MKKSDEKRVATLDNNFEAKAYDNLGGGGSAPWPTSFHIQIILK